MTAVPPEHADDARAALRHIVAEYGPDALAQPSLVSNLLKDLLPEAPALTRMLTAAAELDVAGRLRDQVSHGLDAATAARLAAASLAAATMVSADACAWVVGEIAAALGLATDMPAPAAGGAAPALPAGPPAGVLPGPGSDEGPVPTVTAGPPARPGGAVPGSPAGIPAPVTTAGVAGALAPGAAVEAPARDSLRRARHGRRMAAIAAIALATAAAGIVASRSVLGGSPARAVWPARGSIVAAGDGGTGVTIARSVLIDGVYHRLYTRPQVYAPVTGYYSIHGATGIEQAEARLLAASSTRPGATVYLTISDSAQQAAYRALAAMGKPGAAVAIDPRTGAILALASYPTFNPNDYATLSGTRLTKADKAYRADPSHPLLNRAINATFPPGSTFELVTSAAAFSTGKAGGPGSAIPAPQFYHLPGSTSVLTNDDDSPCGNGNPLVSYAFTVSCDTAFGKLGVTLGGTALYHQASLFGFNDPALTIPLPVSPSQYPRQSDPAFAALSAIGQSSDTVTPLQEAMVAAAIANGGKLMRPYLVRQIRAPGQPAVHSTQPAELRQVVSPQVAKEIATMMRSVTHDPAGTAYATAGPPATGTDIAGKTGTAQNGPNNTNLDDAVFTCFAPASHPVIAVAVIIQGGGLGAAGAAPIALAIIRAYLQRH